MTAQIMDPKKLGTIEWDLLVYKLSDPGNVINLGWVKVLDVNTDTDADRVEVAVQNRAAITGNSPLGLINVQFLENVDAEKIAMFTGATITATAGVTTPIAWEALGTGWTVWQPIKLANKMWDNTEVENIVIDADATPLVLNTDYEVYVSDWTNWTLGYTYIVPKTAQAGVLDADYDYTPNASVETRLTRKYRNDDLLHAQIVTAPDTDGKSNTYTLENCISKGQYKIDLVDLAVAGDIEWTVMQLELSRGFDIVHNVETL